MKIGYIAFLIGVVIFSCLLIFAVASDLFEANKGEKYCKEKGYEGFTHNQDRCYGYAQHPSGVGNELVYSGTIGITRDW